jgi:TPR repeat protein
MPGFSADPKLPWVPAVCTRAAAFVLCLCLPCAPIPAIASDSYEAGTAALINGDYATAWRILAPLAEAGDARAQNDVGVMFGRGLGVPQSYADAAMWIERAAEQGNPHAQSTLGYMYYRARGVDRDYAAAALWSRRSAEQGIASAQSNLGMLYDKGQGVAQDFTEAALWYRRAAEQGFPEAQRNLGSMYEHGSGLPADAMLAYAWYGVASAAGDEIALKLRARMAKGMSPGEIALARELARDLHQRYAAPVQEATSPGIFKGLSP